MGLHSLVVRHSESLFSYQWRLSSYFYRVVEKVCGILCVVHAYENFYTEMGWCGVACRRADSSFTNGVFWRLADDIARVAHIVFRFFHCDFRSLGDTLAALVSDSIARDSRRRIAISSDT